MIRPYDAKTDFEQLKEIHAANDLPEQCLPDLSNPLILHTGIVETEGRVVMSCSIKGTAELYLLVDHEAGTPEDRWKWMQELKEHIVQKAWELGLDSISAWIPNEIEPAFSKRLEELGFIRSPWSCYSLNVEK